MAKLRISLDNTSGYEGYLSNHPADKGGLTYRGIAEKENPTWAGWKIVKGYLANSATQSEAVKKMNSDEQLQSLVEEVYRVKYWNAMRGDEIKSQTVANFFFGSVVNHGVSGGIKLMEKTAKMKETGKMSQELLNYINNLK